MSFGFVSILLFQFVIQSNGGVSRFLNTLLFIFWGLISYNFLYLDTAFLIRSLVYLVVIFLACKFATLANVVISFIHVFNCKLFSDGGVCVCVCVSLVC